MENKNKPEIRFKVPKGMVDSVVVMSCDRGFMLSGKDAYDAAAGGEGSSVRKECRTIEGASISCPVPVDDFDKSVLAVRIMGPKFDIPKDKFKGLTALADVYYLDVEYNSWGVINGYSHVGMTAVLGKVPGSRWTGPWPTTGKEKDAAQKMMLSCLVPSLSKSLIKTDMICDMNCYPARALFFNPGWFSRNGKAILFYDRKITAASGAGKTLVKGLGAGSVFYVCIVPKRIIGSKKPCLLIDTREYSIGYITRSALKTAMRRRLGSLPKGSFAVLSLAGPSEKEDEP
jgi:hypothetical protein